jgi:hypothetical protein
MIILSIATKQRDTRTQGKAFMNYLFNAGDENECKLRHALNERKVSGLKINELPVTLAYQINNAEKQREVPLYIIDGTEMEQEFIVMQD